MSMTCTVCRHPCREEIDRALVAGASRRGIARHYALSKGAVERHSKGHLPAALVSAARAEGEDQAGNLLAQLQYLQTRALAILEAAERAGQLKVALGAIHEAREGLRLILEAHVYEKLAEEIADLRQRLLGEGR